MKTSKTQGFTLIETGIVLIIAGLFMVGLIKAYEINLKEKKEREYIKKTDAITSALAFYIQDHGIAVDINNNPIADDPVTTGVNENRDPSRYPCPANPTLTPGNPLFGVEQRNLGGPGFPGAGVGRCLTTAASGIVSVGAGANRVFYGAVPVVTLDLPIDYAYDDYDNQFTYAVSTTVSDSRWQGNITGTVPPRPRPDGGALGEGENPQGAITIRELDATGALATVYNNMQFSLISHGRNAGGAYNGNGVVSRPCNNNNTGRDVENCDFLTGAPDNLLLDSERNRSSNSNDPSWYDDSLVYTLKGVNDKQDYWALGQANTTDVIMLNTGGVGIGIAAPAEKVDVAGRVRAFSFLHASDERLKENVEPLKQDTLKKLKDVNVVTYDYIEDPEKHKKIGVIAQDLQKIYPEFVFEGKNGFLSVDYVSLTGPLIKGLQELSEEKDKEIMALQGELEQVLKRLEAIENKE